MILEYKLVKISNVTYQLAFFSLIGKLFFKFRSLHIILQSVCRWIRSSISCSTLYRALTCLA